MLFCGSEPMKAVVFQTGPPPADTAVFNENLPKSSQICQKAAPTRPFFARQKRSIPSSSVGWNGLVASLLGMISLSFFILAFTMLTGWLVVSGLAAAAAIAFIRRGLHENSAAEWHGCLMAMIFTLPAALFMWLYGALLTSSALLFGLFWTLPVLPQLIQRDRIRPSRFMKNIFSWFPKLIGEFISTKKALKKPVAAAEISR